MANHETRTKITRSLQVRLALGYSLIIAVLLVLMNTYPLVMTQNLMFRSQQTALQNQAMLITNTLTTADELTPETVEQAITPLDELHVERILVTDQAGLVLYDTQEKPIVGKYALTGRSSRPSGATMPFPAAIRTGPFPAASPPR